MKVFVTGAAGYVGSAIVKALLERGHEVVGLVRRSFSEKDSDPRLTLVRGDLLEPGSYREALAEADAVIHLVGIIREKPSAGATFERIHAEGTRRLLAACREAGFADRGKRFIHMSALGARPGASTDYFRTKWEAEELVRASGMPYFIFRPSVIFGEGSEFLAMLAGLARMPLTPVIGDGKYRMQPVALATVADLFVKALDHPRTNTAWDVGGPGQIPFNDMLRAVAAALGRRVRLVHMPLALMKPMVRAFERLPFFPITTNQLAMLLEENICRDGTPFCDVFDTPPIPFSAGLRNLQGAAEGAGPGE